MSDTKIDKQRHEVSARHKQAIRQFINGLHKQNRDEEREDRLAKEALRSIEKEIKSSGKSFTDVSSTTSATSSTKPTSMLRERAQKPVAATEDGLPAPKVVLFEKKAKTKQVEKDNEVWKYKEKEAVLVDTDLSHIDLLKDDSKPPAPDPPTNPVKKSLFKKRQVRISK